MQKKTAESIEESFLKKINQDGQKCWSKYGDISKEVIWEGNLASRWGTPCLRQSNQFLIILPTTITVGGSYL